MLAKRGHAKTQYDFLMSIQQTMSDNRRRTAVHTSDAGVPTLRKEYRLSDFILQQKGIMVTQVTLVCQACNATVTFRTDKPRIYTPSLRRRWMCSECKSTAYYKHDMHKNKGLLHERKATSTATKE